MREKEIQELIQQTLHYAHESQEPYFFVTPSQIPQSASRAVKAPQMEPAKEKPAVPQQVGTREEPVEKKSSLPPKQSVASHDIKKTLQQLVPSLKLTEAVLDDKEAKTKALSWKERVVDADVLLVALSQDEPTLELLKSLAKAIDTKLAKAKIVSGERLEKEGQWELFFTANASKFFLFSSLQNRYPELAKHLPAQRLLILEEPGVYKHLEKKASLWKTLTSTL